jgi:putative hydrolase of the HAD superfamily
MTASPPLGAALARFDGVLFDAGFTLLEPTRPVGVVYAEAARALGVAVEDDAMTAAVEAAFDSPVRSGSDDDYRTSEAAERARWDEFTALVARGFVGLEQRRRRWLADLVAWFDSAAAWRPAPGSFEVLRALRAAGKRTAVVSNWHDGLHAIARDVGLTALVDDILTSAGVGRRKPHPAMLTEACRRLNLDPRRTAHVGDSASDDLEGARRAGISHIFLLSRKGAGPDLSRISSLEELLSPPGPLGLNHQ